MRFLVLLFILIVSDTLSAQGNGKVTFNPLFRKNILINGGAEAEPEHGHVSGWKSDTTGIQQVKYGERINELPRDTGKYALGGKYYFRLSGKNDSISRILQQDIDLQELTDSIIKNNVQFYLGGSFGGRDSILGSAFLSVVFYDTRGLKVGSWSTKPVGVKERFSNTKLVHREVRDTIPPQAVRATITLNAARGATCKEKPKPACPWEVYVDNFTFVILPSLTQKGKPITTKAGTAGKVPPGQLGKP